MAVLASSSWAWLSGCETATPLRPFADAPSEAWTVEHVVDGDSFRVSRDGVTAEVRMAQVDAPEFGACWATEARDWLEEAIGTQPVGLVPTAFGPDTDQHGRLVREVVVDGASINEAVVAAGMAVRRDEFADEDPELAARLTAAEDGARAAAAGLWGNC